MILKFLLVIGVIAVVYFMFIKKKPLPATPKAKPSKPKEDTNELIKCETCGIYSELSESILSNAKYYCSDECVKKAK